MTELSSYKTTLTIDYPLIVNILYLYLYLYCYNKTGSNCYNNTDNTCYNTCYHQSGRTSRV